MKINSRALALWGVYFVFVAYAVSTHWQETTLRFDGPLGGVKLLVWLALVIFMVYSIYCSMHEDLFRSIGQILKLHWGRQISTDLYLGLFIAMLLIYLHAGPTTALIWLLPTLAFANLSILLYVAVNFDSIAGVFLGS